MNCRLIIPEEVLEGWLQRWLRYEAYTMPARRAPKCWGCGITIKTDQMWHVFFREQQREAHVCDNCAAPYMTKPICSLFAGTVEWHVHPTREQMEKVCKLLKEMGQ